MGRPETRKQNNKDPVFERIEIIMGRHGLTQAGLCEYIGIKPHVYTSWKYKDIHSYHRYLDRIAEYLKVPVEYLLNPISVGSQIEYSLRENQLIEQYRRLGEDKKIEIERIMAYLVSLQEYENEQ